ncbi:nicotinate-nucleotide adenylyltransferase [Fictibacillus sp. WQ 8-8]|uniref:nicotinate-nucleotide adenylyltransferase n=1 Tax=unclassified Fictibacillus TaxID=2644029 RepID=UPI0009E7EE72|nr:MULTISPECIES: nicotinate-nucleotide adenylyltransferase [unclassified Fictibacillus]MCQ6266299.1 nicotinate-nucleotide adenylyltransferase [Fictibacillus sp. WQ 8-8]MED2972482.1 nicotinate-nucleotide adenylyltransferase [Fictibacillus sp. B-59209]
MARIGIFGGSFHPPHNGHLLIAQEALAAFSLDRVEWLPASHPPHKDLVSGVSAEDRIDLVKAAIQGNSKFSLSLIEFEREGPSYTIDTIRELKKREPNHHYFFIIGGDMADSLSTWHGIEELSRLVTFIGINRSGHPLDENQNPYGVQLLEVPVFDVSSTLIRKRIAAGENTKYLIPDDVRKIIEVKGLYGSRKSP